MPEGYKLVIQLLGNLQRRVVSLRQISARSVLKQLIPKTAVLPDDDVHIEPRSQ
jgi:hypothetical protein